MQVSGLRSSPVHAALCLLAILGGLTLAPRAEAQVLGAPGTLTVGVENITGYEATTRKFNNIDNTEITDTTTRFSLFLKNGARIGVHYFLVPHVSLGGSLGYESTAGSVSQPDAGGNYSVDKETDTQFLLHFKAGYLLNLSNSAGFWFRAGPGMNRTSFHPNQTGQHVVHQTFWTLGLDVLFVYAPVPMVGFFAGPTGDMSFVGRHSEDYIQPGNLSYSHSASYRRLGLDFGLMGMF